MTSLVNSPLRPIGEDKSSSYTWGINSNPDKTWGWVRAGAGDRRQCPDLVRSWMIYDKNQGWSVDTSFSISCVNTSSVL